MAWKTPHINDGRLHDPCAEGTILLDSPAWFAWLEQTEHRSFHYSDAAGKFTARKERKQRGQWYWVAYRQAHNALHKAYLGKSAGLSQERLSAAAQQLAQSFRNASEE